MGQLKDESEDRGRAALTSISDNSADPSEAVVGCVLRW